MFAAYHQVIVENNRVAEYLQGARLPSISHPFSIILNLCIILNLNIRILYIVFEVVFVFFTCDVNKTR